MLNDQSIEPKEREDIKEQIAKEKEEAKQKDSKGEKFGADPESEPKEKPLDYDAMMRIAMEVPNKILACEAKLVALMNKQNLLESGMKTIESKTKMEVFDVKIPYEVEIPADKRSMTKEEKEAYIPKYKTEYKLKFTNESSREIETSIRLKDNEEYMKLIEERHLTIGKTMTTKAEIDEAKRTIRSMELVVELMKLKIRVI